MKLPTLIEVWRWPEFQAFAKRLGIAPSPLPTVALTIKFDPPETSNGGLAQITQTYLGRDMKEEEVQRAAEQALETVEVEEEEEKALREEVIELRHLLRAVVAQYATDTDDPHEDSVIMVYGKYLDLTKRNCMLEQYRNDHNESNRAVHLRLIFT